MFFKLFIKGSHYISSKQSLALLSYNYFLKSLLFIALVFFLFTNVYAKSFLSSDNSKKTAANLKKQFQSLPLSRTIVSSQIDYHPSVVFDVLEHLKQNKKVQAFQLLQTIQVSKKIKRDNVYALYLYLLTYLYFSKDDFEMTLTTSNEYIKFFPHHKEVYSMLYYNLYASYKLKTRFVFETSLNSDFLQKFQPTSLVKPFKNLIIEYSQVQTESKLIRFLSKKRDKKLILTSIPKIYSIEFLNNLEKTFLSSEISEKAFLRKIELISFQKNQEKAKKNISLIIKQSQGHRPKTLKKAEELNNDILKKRKNLKIGILLPYSIKAAKIKNIVLDIQTSINIFSQNKNSQYEFIFEDTALKPNTTIKAFKKLAKKNVVAIIGPLSRLNSRVLRKVSSNYKIPLFSLTTEEFLGKGYSYFYRYQRNSFIENQILVNYSLDYLNAKKFVAFYDSKDSYQKVLQFSKEVEKNGGRMVSIEKIESDSIGELRNIFRKITGIYRYLNNREKIVFQELAEKTPEPDIDAIYLPVSPEKIRLISSFFSSYNLKRTYILTSSKFRSPQLNSLALNNLYLADNFSFSKTNPLYSDYQNYYKVIQTRKQPSIYAIAVTNLLNSLDQLTLVFNIQSAKDLKFRLDSLEFIDFFDKQLKIDANGEISKSYNIYQLKNKKTVPVF